MFIRSDEMKTSSMALSCPPQLIKAKHLGKMIAISACLYSATNFSQHFSKFSQNFSQHFSKFSQNFLKTFAHLKKSQTLQQACSCEQA